MLPSHVEVMRGAPFALTSPMIPGGHTSGVHLSVSDATGDSAIFEYVDGELVVHHGAEYRVMTNSPVYDQQLAINAYWQEIGGEIMLPGTSRAADRYARASFYLTTLPTDVDAREAAAGVLSVQRNAAKPLSEAAPGKPELWKTLWTTVIDSTAGRYFFQDTLSPNIFWVDLDSLGFADAVPARRLNLQGHPVINGEASALFEPAEPFAFLGS